MKVGCATTSGSQNKWNTGWPTPPCNDDVVPFYSTTMTDSVRAWFCCVHTLEAPFKFKNYNVT